MGELTHGMNIDEVEELGRFLQQKGRDLEQLLTGIDGKIRASSWTGGDADRFRGDWWPKHKAQLATLAREIDGLGQSALNNASAQRSASEESSADGRADWGRPGHTPKIDADGWYSLAKLVPIVGSVLELGEFVVDTGQAGGTLAYHTYVWIKHGYGSPEERFARGVADEDMDRWRRGGVDVVMSVGGEVIPIGKVKKVYDLYDGGSKALTVTDTVSGTDVGKYTDPNHWVDGLLR